MRTAEDGPTKVERSEDSFPEAEIVRPKAATVWGVLRLLMGFTFLWAFLDKAFALGFSTGRNPETGAIDLFGPDAWINGASPTEGFLSFGLHTKEPFLSFYEGFAGSAMIDWIYMLSMLGIGLALMLGIGTRIAAIGGAVWMVIFYTAAAIWPENNPVIDDHIIEAVVLLESPTSGPDASSISATGGGRRRWFGSIRFSSRSRSSSTLAWRWPHR